MVSITYICKHCGHRHELNGFWRWFFTPHFGSRKFIRCTHCKKLTRMYRADGKKFFDTPWEKK